MTNFTTISTYFPHKKPKKMYVESAFSWLHNFHKLLKDNAANVPIKVTNENYDLLLLIISPTDWETLYGHKWIPSDEPGAPPTLAAGTSTVNIKNIIHSHQNSFNDYNLIINTEAALKQKNWAESTLIIS